MSKHFSDKIKSTLTPYKAREAMVNNTQQLHNYDT